MCRILSISRSGYYDWIKAGRPVASSKDSVLLAQIKQIERENDHNYGVRKIYDELKAKEIKVGRSKVQRVMHENGIRAQIKSKYKPQTTKSNPDDTVFENLLQQDFSTTEINKVWLADITYIRTGGKWSYLATVIDLARRKPVGWAFGSRPTAGLACKALKMALDKEKPAKGLIHHSDRGSQYTSKEYKKLLEDNRIIGSMSRKGNPYGNAPMESFFHLLKVEHVNKRCFSTLKEAAISISKWFIYYITTRRHSALGGISPLEYEIRRNHPFSLSA